MTRKLLAIALVTLSLFSCHKEKDDDEVSVSRKEITFDSNGGEETFEVSSNTTWSISNKPTWLSLSRDSGKGDKDVIITAQQNNEIKERQATLTVHAGDAETTISVRQSGREAVLSLNPTSITFESRQGDSKSFSIKCDKSWTMTNCPAWLTPSSRSGNDGGTSVTLTTASANDTPDTRSGSVVITDGTITAELSVEQQNGRSADCKTTPANVLRMSNDLCYNYQCGSNVKFFYDRLFVTQSMKLRTEDEILASVQQDADMWSRTSSEDASQPVCYGPQLSPGTSYTIVTVSYDRNDRLGEIVKTEFTTKTSVNQPEVYANRLYFTGSGYNSYYGVEVQKGDNGYCSKYYVWAAAGELQTTWIFHEMPAALAWYLKREIAKNPTSHSTNINAQTDALIASMGYTFSNGMPITSSGREYLEGPMSQELASFEKLRHSSDDESIQIVAWGLDVDGEFSGNVSAYLVDLSDFSAKRAIKPLQKAPRTQTDATSFKPLRTPSTNGLHFNLISK